MLPERFLNSIHALLAQDGHPDETASFERAQGLPSARGLRANRLRVADRDTLNRLLTDSLELDSLMEPVPWTPDGLYYPPDLSPAGLAAYHAGLFYIQEPSAMLPAELLGARPGERILDLCAAPGGKSCRIASDLAGEGILWANDISADRIRPLIRNLELMGCANAIVSEETPERLANVMPGWFDRVLVDAPCSGAGMLRRDSRALASLGEKPLMDYVAEQASILTAADRLLRPGGMLVYSTCTFALEENEGQIARFLERHPGYELVRVPLRPGLSEGLPVPGRSRIGVRVWPHRAQGDGHFCAVLIKSGPGESRDAWANTTDSSTGAAGIAGTARTTVSVRAAKSAGGAGPAGTAGLSGLLPEPPDGYRRFLESTLTDYGRDRLHTRLSPVLRLHEGHLHGLPMADIPAGGLRLVKTGLYLGDLKILATSGKARKAGAEVVFSPSHALSHVLTPEDLQHVVSFPLESPETRRYIRGETLFHPDPAKLPAPGSFVGVAGDGYLIGFARQMPDGHLKNLYPPAWRKHS